MVDSLTWFDGIWLAILAAKQQRSTYVDEWTKANTARHTPRLWHSTQDDQEVLGFLKKWRSSKGKDRVVSPWENAYPTQSKTLTHIFDWLVVKEPHLLYSLGVAIFRRKRCQQRDLALMKRKVGDDQARAPGG